MFKQAQSRSGKELFTELMDRAERNLAEAVKDNDFIYHERIPDIKSLEPIGKAQLAKVTPVAQPLSHNFKGVYCYFYLSNKRIKCFVSDLFDDLMPVAVHQAITAYDIRKTEIVNTEISRLRESTQILNRCFIFFMIN